MNKVVEKHMIHSRRTERERQRLELLSALNLALDFGPSLLFFLFIFSLSYSRRRRRSRPFFFFFPRYTLAGMRCWTSSSRPVGRAIFSTQQLMVVLLYLLTFSPLFQVLDDRNKSIKKKSPVCVIRSTLSSTQSCPAFFFLLLFHTAATTSRVF